jgi:hypothetical protein
VIENDGAKDALEARAREAWAALEAAAQARFSLDTGEGSG